MRSKRRHEAGGLRVHHEPEKPKEPQDHVHTQRLLAVGVVDSGEDKQEEACSSQVGQRRAAAAHTGCQSVSTFRGTAAKPLRDWF